MQDLKPTSYHTLVSDPAAERAWLAARERDAAERAFLRARRIAFFRSSLGLCPRLSLGASNELLLVGWIDGEGRIHRGIPLLGGGLARAWIRAYLGEELPTLRLYTAPEGAYVEGGQAGTLLLSILEAKGLLASEYVWRVSEYATDCDLLSCRRTYATAEVGRDRAC